MVENLRDLLYHQDEWTHIQGGGFHIKFNRDGTGEINAIGELGMGWWFTTCMHWCEVPLSRTIAEILEDAAFEEIKHNNLLSKRPELLGCTRMQLDITLENRPPVKAHWPGAEELEYINERMLSKAAFLPRTFTIVIESGNFSAVHDYAGWRGLRITFDVSPYPMLEGYNHDGKGGPPRDWVHQILSDNKSFYAGKPAESLADTRATEDDTILGFHTSNRCAMS